MDLQPSTTAGARAPRRARPLAELAAQLSHQSVAKCYSAYQDVAWDDPALRIDSDDILWELPDEDPFAHTAWYRAQPPAVRTRVGLHVAASFMKIGIQFESMLERGLLDFAFALPNGAPEFRYAYHEVAEETQHSLMFQEFVNRSGYDPRGISPWRLAVGRRITDTARSFPAFFFVAVLAGEEPIDHVQRSLLHGSRPLPPVLERIMRIHVTEEARHLSFARQYLREAVPRLSAARRLQLRLRTPILLRNMSQLMLCVAPDVARFHGIPRSALQEAYSFSNDRHARRTREAVSRTRELCDELGILAPRLWRALSLL
jgi:hypothetical protein